MSELARAAEAHGKMIGEVEGDSHSECSEHDGFLAGARWLLNTARLLTTGMNPYNTPDAVALVKRLEELCRER